MDRSPALGHHDAFVSAAAVMQKHRDALALKRFMPVLCHRADSFITDAVIPDFIRHRVLTLDPFAF